MAHKGMIIALSMIVAISPLSAANPPPPPESPAPTDGPGTRYCLRVDPITGNLVQTVQCWTRAEWADQDVDVDKEWAKNGVAIIRA